LHDHSSINFEESIRQINKENKENEAKTTNFFYTSQYFTVKCIYFI